MTATIIEQPDSRSGSGSLGFSSKQTRHFWAKGAASPAAAITAMAGSAGCPASITCPVHGITLYRSDVRYKPLNNKQDCFDLWCEYEDPQSLDDKQQLAVGSYRFSVNTTGGTARITSSLETIKGYNKYGNGTPGAGFALAAIPDFKQAIGVTREGEVQGVDIVVPACRFQISYRQPKAVITDAYVRTVELLTGTVNSGTFYGRAAGEVLFMGANGSQGIDSDPTWDYEFLRLPNLTGQTIGEILNVAKKGHEYLWVLFEEEQDSDAKYVTKRPKAVYIERVYQSASFAALGIG